MNKDELVEVGEKIRQARALKKISQEELGKVLNLKKASVSLIEKGKRKVTVDEIIKISNRLDKNIEFFLDSKEYKKKQEGSKITYEIVIKATDKVIDSFSLSDYKYGIIFSEVWDKLLEKIGRKDIYVRLNYDESQVMNLAVARELEIMEYKQKLKEKIAQDKLNSKGK